MNNKTRERTRLETQTRGPERVLKFYKNAFGWES